MTKRVMENLRTGHYNYKRKILPLFLIRLFLFQDKELYKKEGLNVREIDFIDNQDCISKSIKIIIMLI